MKNVNIEAMEEKIKNVIGLFEMGILNEHQTVKQLLYLNNVSQQRELLKAYSYFLKVMSLNIIAMIWYRRVFRSL